MTEGWVDCPPLGPGWQRREVLRRNATRPGQSDTYYMSPRGEKIRSRVELSRLLGCSRDLTDFDFRKGVFVDPGSKIKKGSKRHHSPGAAVPHLPKKPPDMQVLEEPLDQKPLELKLELPKEVLTTISSQIQEPLAPVETQPTVKVQPVETNQPTVKVHPVVTTQPIVEAQPVAPTQPIVEAQPVATTQPIIEAQPVATTQPMETTQPTVQVQPMETTQLPVQVQPMETTQPPVQVQPMETTQPPVQVQPMETTQPIKRRNRKHHTSPGKMGVVTVQETISEETIVCASCQGHFPGVMLPSQRRCRWLCPDCRAQRRDFNREQRYYKRIGCGACQACQMSQDCGICRVCVLRAKSPELRIGIKCLLRRCLKIVKKGLECGMCQACKITEDCGSCRICLRRQKPGLKRQWKCLKRRCLKCKKKILPKKDGCTSKKLTDEAVPAKDAFAPVKRRKKQPALATKQQLGVVKEKRKVGRPPKHPTCTSTSRRNRKCGKCEACLLKMDCGRCDFCCDKPKFGGKNLKHQKCRWRQCLHFAMVEESPLSCELLDLSKARNPEISEPEQQLKKQPEMIDPVFKQPVKKQPILPLRIKEEPEVPQHPSPPAHMKVSAGLSQVKRARGIQGKEVVVLDDEDDEVEQLEQMRPPVIMEIYSLHDVQPLSQLDSVLQEFLAELNEIPLPAHWEVLPPLGGPNLRLVQRSKHSTMSAAVIHIRPGLFFHVVLRDLPVPLEHKLYTRHPARLTTVDEVVELICDLEAYRLCPGWPAGWHAGERSQTCDVLVYSGCCPKCRLNPWPSGSGTR